MLKLAFFMEATTDLNVIDGIVFRDLLDPLPIRDQNIADTHRIDIGKLNRVKRSFDHHVVESEPDYSPTSSCSGLMIRLGLEIPA